MVSALLLSNLQEWHDRVSCFKLEMKRFQNWSAGIIFAWLFLVSFLQKVNLRSAF